MDIDILTAKYLSGESTPEETDRIDRWRKSSLENDLIFRQSEEVWHLTNTHLSQNRFNKERTWSRIQKNISRGYSLSVLLRVTGIAASIAIVLGWSLARIFTDDYPCITADPSQQITLYVPAGITSKTILPDSTVVWLNSSSRISYPSYFDGDTRTVELIGEAFFDVAHNENKPFIIESGDLKINVLGTSFNFKHYLEDTHAILAVETGTVRLSSGSTSNITLQAGHYATVDNHTLYTNVYYTPYYSSWRNNKIVFHDEPFGNVLKELARKYGVEFEIQDNEIKDYIYTATFDNMNLDDILNLFKISSPIDYSITSLTRNTTNAYETRKVTVSRK